MCVSTGDRTIHQAAAVVAEQEPGGLQGLQVVLLRSLQTALQLRGLRGYPRTTLLWDGRFPALLSWGSSPMQARIARLAARLPMLHRSSGSEAQRRAAASHSGSLLDGGV